MLCCSRASCRESHGHRAACAIAAGVVCGCSSVLRAWRDAAEEAGAEAEDEGSSVSTKVLQGAAKRKPPAAGKGRPKGSQNKVTKALKDMILGALDDVGGQDYLQKQATENPQAFMTLIGKVLPLQIAGDANAPITVQLVTLTSKDEQAQAWRPPA